MKHSKITLLTSLLLIFGLSGCNVIFNKPTSGSGSDSSETVPDVTSVEVDPSSLAIAVGDTYQMNATCLPSGSNQAVTWKSSKLNIATVDETGLVTAKAVGTVKIYATSAANPRVSGYCTLTVAAQIIKATSVTLDKHETTLNMGGTLTLHSTITPSNATGGVVWSSSDESIVTVNNGKITAVGFGTAVVKAAAASDGNVYDECTVTVEKVRVTSISLDKTSLNAATGSEVVLTPTLLPSNADDQTVSWKSDNNSVARVDETGRVYCLKAGTATITATSNDNETLSASCAFTISDVHPTAMTLSKTKVSVSPSSTTTIEAVFTPEDTSNKNVTWTSSDTKIATVSDGEIYGVAIGECTITAVSEDGGLTATCDVTVETLSKTSMKYDYEDLTDNNVYQIDSIPSTGNPKMIVIPVWMTDSGNYISSSEKETVRSDIESTYFGTTEETGWHSVSSYYNAESFGGLNLTGTVTDWYSCGYSSKNVDSETTQSIVTSAVSWFKSSHSDTYSDYDTNGDGYLDAVCLIYAAPDYDAGNGSNDNLWAYCYWMQDSPGTASNPTPNVFFWASYDFMYDENNPKIGNYGNGDCDHCSIDAHTFIHEMGHIFGLSDYYDYNSGYEAAGGFSMQDYNVGAHDPFSKMALNWVEPYVPTDSITITIKPLETDGDLILLSPKFQGSPFDEYILIELYSPLGLNQLDSKYKYQGYYPQGPSSYGCRVWHVDCRLASYSGGKFTLETSPVISSSKMYTEAFTNSTFKSASDGRGSVLATSSSDAYAKYRQLQLIRQDYTTDEKCGDMLASNDLFTTGDTFDMTTYAKCFVNNGKLNNGKSLGFSVHFDSVSSSGATLTITKG